MTSLRLRSHGRDGGTAVPGSAGTRAARDGLPRDGPAAFPGHVGVLTAPVSLHYAVESVARLVGGSYGGAAVRF
jgi:hypothetical protein